MTNRPKHLTLRPNEVARFLRPSGLVILPCKEQPLLPPRDKYLTMYEARVASALKLCPLGGPGTEWVGREAFIPCVGCGLDSKTADASYVCLEDGTQIFRNGNVDKWTLKDPPNWKGYRFRPASRMPDWAARIRKTTTRVELLRRVRTITEAEANQTGVECDRYKSGYEPGTTQRPRQAFEIEFNARYPGAWDRDDYAFFCWYTDTH